MMPVYARSTWILTMTTHGLVMWAMAAPVAVGDGPAAREHHVSAAAIQKVAGQPALLFPLAGDREAIPLAQAQQVRILHSPDTPIPLSPPFRLRWSPLEYLAVRDIRMEGDQVRCDSPLGPVSMPARRVWGVEAAWDGMTRLAEDFSNPSLDAVPGWHITGSPQRSESSWSSPPASLLLSRHGQRLVRSIKPAVEAGTLRLAFYEPDEGMGLGRWSVALASGNDRPADLRFVGGWEHASYAVESIAREGASSQFVSRRRGWHLLEVDFGPSHRWVAVDRHAVFWDFTEGIDRGVAELRMEVEPMTPGDPRPPGRVWLDDFLLIEKGTSFERGLADPSQADVESHAGDQWLGRIEGSDGRLLRFRVATGSRIDLPWAEIRSARFPRIPAAAGRKAEQGAIPAAPPELLAWSGEIGELRLSGDQGVLLATLTSASDRRGWEVMHPLLGKLHVPTRLIASWKPRVVGRRLELLADPIHLGVKLVEGFRSPAPAGSRVGVRFEHDASLGSACAWVWVSHMEGIGPQAPFAAVLGAGELRTELWLNDQRIDWLNHHLVDRSAQPKVLRIPLTPQRGDNHLEIRQTPDRQADHDEIEVLGLAIEWGEAGEETP